MNLEKLEYEMLGTCKKVRCSGSKACVDLFGLLLPICSLDL